MSEGITLRGAVAHLDMRALVPEAYARYRPVISDALGFFLGHLPAHELEEIHRGQQGLPPWTSPAQRLVLLMRACPTLHKLGQVVARDRRLSEELRGRLVTLESMEATTPPWEIQAVVERELGPLLESRIRLEPKALAEGSVAVVVPFRTVPDDSEGVLKVLKPGVDERLWGELDVWSKLGAFLDERCGETDLPAVPYQETFETLRELLVHEIRLEAEQRNLQVAARLYGECDFVRIPELLPYCTPRITAMERIRGPKVTDAGNLSLGARCSLAARLIEALIAHPMWSPRSSVPFHADPHAGNLLLADDGRLAIIDWALVGRLSRVERAGLVQLALGALTLNEPYVLRAIDALSTTNGLKETRVRDVVEKAIRRLELANPPGIRWLIDLLDSLSLHAGVRFSSDLLLFRKSFLTVDGVVTDVWRDSIVDDVLIRSAIRGLWSEWSRRIFASPVSRDFATPVSSLDLLRIWLSLPYATSRLCFNRWKNALSA